MGKYTKFILTVIAILLAGNIAMSYYSTYKIYWGLRHIDSGIDRIGGNMIHSLDDIHYAIDELKD